MTEILSNLLGEIVEASTSEYHGGSVTTYIAARGVVRAIYPTERGGATIVIEDIYNGEPYGRLRGLDFYNGAVRVVRMCQLCGTWDHPGKLVRETPDPDCYEHATCRKRVGHGG